ncbi:hypothetical protein [Dictyobacter formicarum]|uniref:4-vinyl reductase 4VR domain-containing protein n=1 Tax=Dictyobacter formicarum TaxID=2778368 RepID=A0ABQ3VLZ0_9CHLR|nr:hypothetical protein [Dictyobacter formicarum]GHO86373.1 hypothetical protein KSZ_43790 [Dictyobacter formicarum]
MAFAPGEPPSVDSAKVLKKAREHVLLIIDSDEVRSQYLARLLTLAGLRAIVTSTPYQAFGRFLKERFVPRLILLGQQEETTSPIFSRFLQRLTMELQQEIPVMPLASIYLPDGLVLSAEDTISSTMHCISPPNSLILKRIWQFLPSAQIPLKTAEHTMVLELLPKLGFKIRVARSKRSFSSHLHLELKAAKQVIPPEQWNYLLTDVGLAQFCKEEQWPPAVDQSTIPPQYFALLMRAVMFSAPMQPLQQVYRWAGQVEADTLQKAIFLFLMQQIPKVIGADRTMRTLLTILTNEIDNRRGEKLTEWKRFGNGSFIFVFYSNIFVYSVMGAEQPLCMPWQYSFDLMLRLVKQEQQWDIREVECSAQTHTGHCVFLISPRTN